MARLARIVVSAVPHHVTQRGNRRQTVFFGDDDYRSYLALLSEQARSSGVATWAWCLMPNHVHLMLVPPTPDACAGRCRRRIGAIRGWSISARAGAAICGRAALHPVPWTRRMRWRRRAMSSSIPCGRAWSRGQRIGRSRALGAHLTGHSDGLTRIGALGNPPEDWPDFLAEGLDDAAPQTMRRGERTGGPLGDADFRRAPGDGNRPPPGTAQACSQAAIRTRRSDDGSLSPKLYPAPQCLTLGVDSTTLNPITSRQMSAGRFASALWERVRFRIVPIKISHSAPDWRSNPSSTFFVKIHYCYDFEISFFNQNNHLTRS
jgi:putative transposase